MASRTICCSNAAVLRAARQRSPSIFCWSGCWWCAPSRCGARPGMLPRLCGFAGTFLGVGILQLKPRAAVTALADRGRRRWCWRGQPGFGAGAVAAGQVLFHHARSARAGDQRALCLCPPSALCGGDASPWPAPRSSSRSPGPACWRWAWWCCWCMRSDVRGTGAGRGLSEYAAYRAQDSAVHSGRNLSAASSSPALLRASHPVARRHAMDGRAAAWP